MTSTIKSTPLHIRCSNTKNSMFLATPILSSPSTSPGLTSNVYWQLMKRVAPGDSTHVILPTLTKSATDTIGQPCDKSNSGLNDVGKKIL